jgi:hypothetical protein
MLRGRTGWIVLGGLALATTAFGHTGSRHDVPGQLVGVAVEVGGRPARLYPAPDGSGRHYVEAREGASYALRLTNHCGERLGVVVTVDGLNAISGARDQGRGRMYVLDPWQQTTVRGWRTSLQDVRRFTFVEEEASYAARSGKANARMGWIELAVYRERRHWSRRDLPDDRVSRGPGEDSASPGRAEAPAPEARGTDSAEAEARPRAKSQADTRARSYPGTGWGRSARDPVVLVDFEPRRSPAQRTTLRYEYREALVALGVLPAPDALRDRLAERDRGRDGFAPPPLW